MQFPRIIHQIWLQGTNLVPAKYFENIKSIKDLQPKWLYIIWDEEMIIRLIQHNKTWLKTYHSLKYLHQKVDYGRYIILYLYGGAYLDMDANSVKPLDSLINKYRDYDMIVSYIGINKLDSTVTCQREKCINNGIIICKPYIDILKMIIDHIDRNNKCNNLMPKITCISKTTGPTMFTKVILDNINVSNIKILNSEYLEPCIYSKCNITKNTYTVHKHEGSWYSDKLKKLGIIYVNHKSIIYFIFIMLLFMCIL